MRTYELDGRKFSTLEEFWEHFSDQVLSDHSWGCNLDAFNDVLRGGFGTPDEGFQLVWINSDLSRDLLGCSETVRQLEIRLESCHSSNRVAVASDLHAAKHKSGSTVFDWIVEIIETHGKGGEESEDGIELYLR